MQGWLSRDEKSKLTLFGKDASLFNWKRYYFQQIGNSLAYYKTESTPKQSGIFPVDEVIEIQLIPDSPDAKNAFKLIVRGKERELSFMADTPESLKYWVTEIAQLNPEAKTPFSEPIAVSNSSDDLGDRGSPFPGRGRARDRDLRPVSMFGQGSPLPADLQQALANRGRGGAIRGRGGPGGPGPRGGAGLSSSSPRPADFAETESPTRPEPPGPSPAALRGRGGIPRVRPVSSIHDVREARGEAPVSSPFAPRQTSYEDLSSDIPSAPSYPGRGMADPSVRGIRPHRPSDAESPPMKPAKPSLSDPDISKQASPSRPGPTPRPEPPSLPQKPDAPPTAHRLSISGEPPSLPTKLPAVEPPSLPTKPPVVEPPSLPTKPPVVEPPSLPTKLPAVEPPFLPSKPPVVEPPSLPSKPPVVEPPSLPTKPPVVEPPSLPSKPPVVEPPSLPSKPPVVEPPSLPSKPPVVEPPSLPSKPPVIEPPSLPQKPTALEPPPIAHRPSIGDASDRPPLPFKPSALDPPGIPSRPPGIDPPALPVKPGAIEPPGLPAKPSGAPSLPFKPNLPLKPGIRPPHLPPKPDGGPPGLATSSGVSSSRSSIDLSSSSGPATPGRLLESGDSTDELSGSQQEEEKPLTPEEQKALIQQKRTKIVEEMISTEETYIKNLTAMLSIYKRIFEEWVDLLEGKSPPGGAASARGRSRPVSTIVQPKQPQTKFKREHIKILFSNIQVVIPLNQQLYEEITGRYANWDENQRIGDIFVKMAPYFKLYNEYSNNYGAALELFDRMYSKDVAFVKILEAAEAEAELQGVLRFENLLILPIQRIPRYSLLVADLLRKTDPSHPDHQSLTEAQVMLEATATYLDSHIQQSENNKRLMELALEGASKLLASHRTLIREGSVTVSTEKKPKKFKLRLTLFNDLLVHLSEAKSKKKSNMEQQKHQWPLYLVWLRDLVDAELEEKFANPKEKEKHPFAFQVTGPLDTYVFWFSDQREKQSWFTSISNATKDELLTRKFMQTIPSEIAGKVADTDFESMAPDKPVRVGVYHMLNGGIYQGWWNEGKMHGFGAFSFFGNIYLGQFAWNVKNGAGELHYATGEVYTGYFAHDLPNGQGTLVLPNGDRYEGEWQAGSRQGRGVFLSAAGDRFEGDWIDDYPTGQGMLVLSDGTKYTGNWERGQFDKQGVLEMADGRVYRGEFSKGLRQGQGVFDYTGGTTYSGSWFQGKQSGKGNLTTPTWIYEGDFVEDEPHGRGIMEWISGARYEGEWCRGKFHGQGEYTSPIGRIKSYKGEWHHQQMHGRGQITYHNDCTYAGEFIFNVPNGKGIFLFPDRTRLETSWKAGQPEGKANLLSGSQAPNKLQTLQGRVQGKVFEPQTGEPIILVPPTTTFPIFQIFL